MRAGHDDHRRACGTHHQTSCKRYGGCGIEHHTDRLIRFHAGKADIETRVVGTCRPCPNQNGIMQGTLTLYPGVGHRARDEQPWVTGGRRRKAIGCLGYLERDERPAFDHATNMAGVVLPRLIRENAPYHGNAGGPQALDPTPGDTWVWVAACDDDTRNPGRHDCVSAGFGMPVVAARLERDIEGRASGTLAGRVERLCFSMRPTPRSRNASADDHPILDQQSADRRIWCRATKAAPAERQGCMHEARVV